MKKLLLFALTLFSLLNVHAQEKDLGNIQGMVIDTKGEAVIGATLQLFRGKKFISGAATDEHGFYNLHMEPGDSIVISAIGYKKIQYIHNGKDPDLFFELERDHLALPEIVVSAFVNRRKCDCSTCCCCLFGTRPKPYIDTIQLKVRMIPKEWTVYPNPTVDRVHVNTEGFIGSIALFGPNGVLQETRKIDGPILAFDLTALPAGTYFLRYFNPGWQQNIGSVVKIRD